MYHRISGSSGPPLPIMVLSLLHRGYSSGYHSQPFTMHLGCIVPDHFLCIFLAVCCETITALTGGKEGLEPFFLTEIWNVQPPPLPTHVAFPFAQTKPIGITFFMAFLRPRLLPLSQASFHVYGAFLLECEMSVIVCHASWGEPAHSLSREAVDHVITMTPSPSMLVST